MIVVCLSEGEGNGFLPLDSPCSEIFNSDGKILMLGIGTEVVIFASSEF